MMVVAVGVSFALLLSEPKIIDFLKRGTLIGFLLIRWRLQITAASIMDVLAKAVKSWMG